MATKKSTVGNIFKKTTTAPAEGKPEEKPKPTPYGVYLDEDMRRDMEKIREKTGMNNHALLQFAIKYFIQQYNAGKIQVTKKTINTLEL